MEEPLTDQHCVLYRNSNTIHLVVFACFIHQLPSPCSRQHTQQLIDIDADINIDLSL